MGLALVAVGAWFWGDAPQPARPVKFVLAPGLEAHDPEVSPDGRYVAFVTYDGDGALWVRDLSEDDPRQVPETDGARKPFWSPDSRHIGFSAGSSLWRASVTGDSPPREICTRCVSGVRGGAWTPDGKEILIASLHIVSADGGTPTRIERDRSMGYSADPQFLPIKGRRVVALHQMTPTGNQLQIVDLDRGKYHDIGAGRDPVYSPTKHLVYQDEGPESRIWARPFSLAELDFTGEPFLVADNAFSPSISDDGALVYLEGDAAPVERLVWRDRSGGNREIVSVPLPEARFIDLSPDETKVTYSGVSDGRRSVFIADLTKPDRPPRQFTFGEVVSNDNHPKWSPDGERVAYHTHSGDTFAGSGTWIKPIDGSTPVLAFPNTGIVSQFLGNGEAELLVNHGPVPDIPDGMWTIQFGEVESNGGVRLQPFLRGPDGDRANCAKISPDGRHIVYVQNRAVMVRTFPDGRGPWRLSRPGERASQPRWGPDGDEVFYANSELLVVARVTTEDSFEVTSHEELFRSDGLAGHVMPMYDLSSDGQRIILLDPAPEEEPTLRVTQNWFTEFENR